VAHLGLLRYWKKKFMFTHCAVATGTTKPMIISLLDESTHDEDDDDGDDDDSPIARVRHDFSYWMIKYNLCLYIA
jgi:hypothetical protein